ncbi:uncharacterized protein FIBRA_07214 [Fibroporia radiculosa]|uniref:Mitochondrial intermembrane space import and assembly protein 40 n=1 Tax=Fibroporia radiculosa TaxID=599839 RepID=J4GUI9_9APHY|nr:uncharacterized protein FIBRA_07214 [Fibroporia radiculosa]CCM05015.1 predicted protein [Fibroporia radiculosa]
MFRTLAKVPLRRCLHTSSPRSTAVARPSRVIIAGSAAVATYLTWRTLYGENVALDSVASPSTSSSLVEKATLTPETVSKSHPPTTAQEATLDESPVEPDSTPTTAQPEEGEADEADAGSGGAFNPVTGEINWDCPCLGGMAYGPCGLQFREAFSCFVYSEKEPKGIDCVEKFKAMQSCFRDHPEVYGDDIMNDDDDEDSTPLAGDSPVGGQTTEASQATLELEPQTESSLSSAPAASSSSE